MDAVITYVDGLDPVWREEYGRFTDIPVQEKRFRNWGTLKYLLRGIETRMPFVRNVYLVVSGTSQVPAWADRTQLKVVCHKELIPQRHLPTFNSAAIEMFLHKISGLDEEYLYFNDDMYPVAPCRETDFFRNGRIVFGFAKHLAASGLYKKQCRNSDRLARRTAGKAGSPVFVRPQHTCTPMLKSACEEVFSRAEPEILASLSPLREEKNCNQYLFPDYLYHTGRAIVERQSKKHFSLAVTPAEKISGFLRHPTRKIVCINDVDLSEDKFEQLRAAILTSFENLFPEKSRFEL